MSNALRQRYQVRTPNDLSGLHFEQVYAIANLYFDQHGDIPRKKFVDAIDAAKEMKKQVDRLLHERSPPPLPPIIESNHMSPKVRANKVAFIISARSLVSILFGVSVISKGGDNFNESSSLNFDFPT